MLRSVSQPNVVGMDNAPMKYSVSTVSTRSNKILVQIALVVICSFLCWSYYSNVTFNMDQNTIALGYGRKNTSGREVKSQCFTMQFVGRMGNIMFEYASLIGICAKHGSPVDKCAHFYENPGIDQFLLPTHEFKQTFNLTTFNGCRGIDSNEPNPHYTEASVGFDPVVFLQKNRTNFAGYYQSWKYFHPHAKAHVQNAFKFSDSIQQKSRAFLQSVERDLAEKGGLTLVCMAVRRGDKVGPESSQIYDKWALSLDYYLSAIDHFRSKYKKIGLLTFTGGSVKPNQTIADRKWTENHIHAHFKNSPEVVPISDDPVAGNHILSLSVLSLCPNIIVASSSYSWWAAYLANHSNVVAPKYLHANGVAFFPEDYYLPEWILLTPKNSLRRLAP